MASFVVSVVVLAIVKFGLKLVAKLADSLIEFVAVK